MSLDDIWPQADYITVHTPLIPQTKRKRIFFGIFFCILKIIAKYLYHAMICTQANIDATFETRAYLFDETIIAHPY